MPRSLLKHVNLYNRTVEERFEMHKSTFAIHSNSFPPLHLVMLIDLEIDINAINI